MRTSLNEIKEIEDYLQKEASREDSLLFEAKLIIDSDLRQKVSEQQKVYKLIQTYSRKKLKEEIEAIHQLLFTKPEHLSFRQKIYMFFSKP